jgi:diaminobutyrate-2-oxoglutarate transaminase
MSEDIFTRFESDVRYYCRNFPVTFVSGKGARVTDIKGRSYIDLLSGAGTLNYGHNNPAIVRSIIRYLNGDGIVHSLDMHTQAKAEFISTFQDQILLPRKLAYKLQFPGPTGTNAIEAAIKLARKVTGRTNVIAFTNAFHGMSLGALATTANPSKRAGAGVPLNNCTFMPFDGYLGSHINTLDVIEPMLRRAGSGIDKPAAILVELVQGEGGLNVASPEWVQRLARLAADIGALLIVDDIQAGNGRTGSYFSFEGYGVVPDIVVLSKSLSGFGTPFSLVLLRPEHDLWQPGEHNGTFRGNNLGFVGATSAIELYWTDQSFQSSLENKSKFLHEALTNLTFKLPAGAAKIKGRGLFLGLEFTDSASAHLIASRLFQKGVIIETCGPHDQVLKLLPPLTIEKADLSEALNLLEETVLEEYLPQAALAG